MPVLISVIVVIRLSSIITTSSALIITSASTICVRIPFRHFSECCDILARDGIMSICNVLIVIVATSVVVTPLVSASSVVNSAFKISNNIFLQFSSTFHQFSVYFQLSLLLILLYQTHCNPHGLCPDDHPCLSSSPPSN